LLKIGHTELFVKDPLASRRFYEEVLGFEVVAVQQERFVWLKLGETEILLRPTQAPPNAPDYQHAHVGIVLYTDDLEKTAAALKTRGLEFKGTDGPDCCLTFTDPDGHWFQLVNPEDHS
jgi:catechol 2,3-dioxygenase-like lactoylglutathione lyase family enzyme